MKKIEGHFPLIVTVGQVAIFPYYIIWLKEVAMTYTLFAWLFAAFSFAAAWGYHTYQIHKKKRDASIAVVYIGMGCSYIVIQFFNQSVEILPYVALLLQVVLGFLQGYFRSWHIEQNSYRLHAVHHYLIVGIAMVMLSFIRVVSPVTILTIFGYVLCGYGILVLLRKQARSS